MTLAHLLNRTFARWQQTETTDAGGGVSVSWAQNGTVKGRLSSPSPTERQAAAQEGVQVTHVVYLPSDTDVARGERLVVDGITVEVLTLVRPSIPDHHAKATAREEPWDEPTS